MLEKSFLDRIIRKDEVALFEKELKPHQKGRETEKEKERKREREKEKRAEMRHDFEIMYF